MKIQDFPIEIYSQLPLSFSFESLNPYLDKATIEKNYNYHYREYADNLNIIVQELGLENISLTQIFENDNKYSKDLLNNAGGYYNYSLLWKIITPNCGGDLSTELMNEIDKSFNSFEQFKNEFEKAALTIIGSGWAWLVIDSKNNLKIVSTKNEENPLMKSLNIFGTPIIAINMWERMYYLKYNDDKNQYVSNFWSLLNWKTIDEIYKNIIWSKYL